MQHTKEFLAQFQALMRDNGKITADIKELRKLMKAKDKKIAELEREIKQLRGIIDKNSSNSSKPPSTDAFKKIHNSREQTGKPIGGQPGHKGHWRKLYAEPTEIVEHKQATCECGGEIKYARKYIAKQYIDLNIQVNITEHRAYSGKCPCCEKKHENKLPENLINPVTYGSNLKALTILLSTEGCISVNRIKSILRETTNEKIEIAESTIINWQSEIAGKTHEEIVKIKSNLLSGKVTHKDETGVRVEKDLHWLHVTSNKDVTLYHANPKRGNEADDAIGILPVYKGVLVRDHHKPLLKYHCEHQECNAHILRYLKAEVERKRNWAGEMIALLVEAHRETLSSGQKKQLHYKRLIYYESEYDRILDAGIREHKASSERIYRTDNINLLERMQKYKSAHLLFMSREDVPFDNNLAERDLRMIKTKSKVSGCFRSTTGVENFAAIKSVLSTARKQSKNLFQTTLAFC